MIAVMNNPVLRRRQILRLFDRVQNDALGNVPNHLDFADPGRQNKMRHAADGFLVGEQPL